MATVRELAEPWSPKIFIFHRPETKENKSSIVVRLSGGGPEPAGFLLGFFTAATIRQLPTRIHHRSPEWRAVRKRARISRNRAIVVALFLAFVGLAMTIYRIWLRSSIS